MVDKSTLQVGDCFQYECSLLERVFFVDLFFVDFLTHSIREIPLQTYLESGQESLERISGENDKRISFRDDNLFSYRKLGLG